MSRGPIVFLDKDGTLIEDLPYNVDPTRIRFAPGSRAGLRRLAGIGARAVIVTNQSGVARGYFRMTDLDPVAEWLARELGLLGVPLAGFYACPHLPDGVNEFAIDCDCRKPEPGLLVRAADDLQVDPCHAWMIGDTWMDVEAGRRAGCSTILIGPDGLGPDTPPGVAPDHRLPDLDHAAQLIVRRWGGRVPSVVTRAPFLAGTAR